MSTYFTWPLSLSTPSGNREAKPWNGSVVVRISHIEGGGLMFFLVERSTFASRVVEQWEIRIGRCYVCSRDGKVIRLAHALGHNKLTDERAEFRCLRCAEREL